MQDRCRNQAIALIDPSDHSNGFEKLDAKAAARGPVWFFKHTASMRRSEDWLGPDLRHAYGIDLLHIPRIHRIEPDARHPRRLLQQFVAELAAFSCHD